MIFDFFRKRDYNNVVKFPQAVPHVEPPPSEPEPQPEPQLVYSIGVTDSGAHMTLKLGLNTLTMTKLGCQQLIDQLEVFKNQLKD